MPPAIRLAIRWALILGGAGFAAGFFGPMLLDPESNIGPIVGLLFSGPGGALAGAVLGALFGVLHVGRGPQQLILAAACVALASVTLYCVLPEPALRGYVIDAEVEACAPPARGLDAAMAQWEEAVGRVTWAAPAANWKETASDNVRNDPGVVLTMRIHRKRAILRHRKPWDRGDTSAGPWLTVAESKQYYASDEGPACEAYLARQQRTYWPAIDPNADPTKPAAVWPPTDTLGFLHLQAMGPVPAQYERLSH